MTATAALVGCWLATSGLAAPTDLRALLDRLGEGDLVLANDPRTARPVRVLLATRVAARAEAVRQVLVSPASYAKAMPAFRRVEVASRRSHGAGRTDLEVVWELDVPLWNLQGKLWLRPRADGADLELAQGDFAPGLFHLTALAERGGNPDRAILVIEGHANVRDANVATRQLVQRSSLAESAMTVAAAYVMLKSLAALAETGKFQRPTAALVAPEPSSLAGAQTGAIVASRPRGTALMAVVRSRPDGRLAQVEVGLPLSARAAEKAGDGLAPEILSALPSWKKVTVVGEGPDVCTDPVAPCWSAQSDLPLFSLDGTWKFRWRPWRARMVAGEREGALLGVDIVRAHPPATPVLVLSEHPRLDKAGYAARKLVDAEPYLEHGLALALTLVDAVSLVPALEQRYAGKQ